MLLFNGITGELKEVPKSILRVNMKHYEYVFTSADEIPLKERQKLLNQTKLDDEIFRTIPGADNYYVSNYGRVKKIYPVSKKEKIMTPFLKQRPNSVGYVCVKVKLGDKHKELKISKLVASCFSIKGTGNQIYHINKNKWDNSATNLKYVTHKELIKIPQRLSMHSVIKIDPDTLEELDYYPSIREAGRCEFISHEAIRMCVKGVQKTAGGFKWAYDK